MDVFKFHTSSDPGEDTHLVGGGEYVSGLLTKEWVERYREPGSFSFTSRATSNIRKMLPEGTLIGLRGSKDVMIVEDHQLSDDNDAIIVTTTGRSLESFLENRIVRYELVDGEFVFDTPEDQLTTWAQAIALIKSQIIFDTTGSDQIKYLEVRQASGMSLSEGTKEPRKVPRGELYSAVKSILDVDDLGWRIIRPGPWSPAADPTNNIVLLIHKGVDRSQEVAMSYDSGDIESADYLWSIQQYKTQAVIYGTWRTTSIGDSTLRGLKRRVLYVDGKDIDEKLTSGSGWPEALTTYVDSALRSRGSEELAKRKPKALSAVSPKQNSIRYIFGRDYDIGDIITVRGNFTESRRMRVTEYVRIEDENGEFGYPTLEILEEETV